MASIFTVENHSWANAKAASRAKKTISCLSKFFTRAPNNHIPEKLLKSQVAATDRIKVRYAGNSRHEFCPFGKVALPRV